MIQVQPVHTVLLAESSMQYNVLLFPVDQGTVGFFCTLQSYDHATASVFQMQHVVQLKVPVEKGRK